MYVTFSGRIKHPVTTDPLFQQPRVNWLACGIWLAFWTIVLACAMGAVYVASLAH